MAQKKKWPIMHAIGTAFLTLKRYRQKQVLPYGITLKQFYVLRQLKKEGVLNPSEIADMLFCDRPTATVVIKNMEKQGWVKRELDPEDSRRLKVTLEPAGQTKLKELVRKLADSKKESFTPLSCFTSREKDQFTKLLAKLNLHIKEHIN
ncbi:MAG: MarR family transcriptional regulator [Deltaproteobacteria bacterium]|nr:MarR family transcriptional regulator [Deltaproteobacteria bacterium]